MTEPIVSLASPALRVPPPANCCRGKGHTTQMALAAYGTVSEETKSELGTNGQSLMSRLCQEAPGTVFHSLGVSGLMPDEFRAPIHQAAVLLHDIGKLVYANQFAENVCGQATRPHPHVLLSHVDGGIVLANYYQLGANARAAILEHHGTLPVAPGIRYRGRIPHSLFTAVLMMTDTIEALTISQALDFDLVHNMYLDRKDMGQFALVDDRLVWDLTQSVFEKAASLPSAS